MRILCAALAFLFLLYAMPVSGSAADKHEAVSDDQIHDDVMRRLAGDPIVKGGGIEVEVKDGAVVLKGKVMVAKQKEKAEKLAKKVRGVQSVSNQLVVER